MKATAAFTRTATLSHLRVRFLQTVPDGNTWTPWVVLCNSAVAASVDKVLLVNESNTASKLTQRCVQPNA